MTDCPSMCLGGVLIYAVLAVLAVFWYHAADSCPAALVLTAVLSTRDLHVLTR